MKEQFQGASEIAYNKLTAREPHTPVNNPPAFVSQFPALENNLAPPQELIIQRTRQESRSKNTFPEDIRLFALRASRGGERCQRPECSVLRQISRTADRSRICAVLASHFRFITSVPKQRALSSRRRYRRQREGKRGAWRNGTPVLAI